MMGRLLPAALLALAALFAPTILHAHGGEDHSHPEDAKAAPVAPIPGVAGGPRLEIDSADVALLAVLDQGTLTVYLDRYASNEPIADARLELEVSGASGSSLRAEPPPVGAKPFLGRPGERLESGTSLVFKAVGPGTYQAPAPWLARPGRYEVVFTVQSPTVDDLLIGTWLIAAPTPASKPVGGAFAPANWPTWAGLAAWVAAGAAALAVLAGAVWLYRRRRGGGALVLAALTLALALAAPADPAIAHGGEEHGPGGHDEAGKAVLATAPVSQSGGVPSGVTSPMRLPDGGVHVPKPTQRLLGLRTVLAEKREQRESIELKGHVIADPNASGHVQAGFAGRVEAGAKGLPHLGQRVARGEVLAWLAPVTGGVERGNQQALLAELAGQEEVARQRLARYEQLEGSIPRKDIEAARADLAALKARRAAVSTGLHGREALRAPVAGVVSDVSIVVGQVVEARDTLFEVIEPQRLWLEAVGFDMAQVADIRSATAEGPGGSAIGLDFLGAGRRLREQAIPLQFRLRPPLPPLTVGQPLKLYVESGRSVAGVPLPNAALVRSGSGETLVWLHTGAERFTPRKVRVQTISATHAVVVEGLAGGERVVVGGAALLSRIR